MAHTPFAPSASSSATTSSGSARGFRDLSLRVKLLALSLVAAAVTLTVGVVAQGALGGSQAALDTVANVDAKPAIHLGDASLSWSRWRRYTVQEVAWADPDQVARAAKGREAQEKAFMAAMDALEASSAPAELKATAKDLRAKADAVFQKWSATYVPAARAATTGDAVQQLMSRVEKDVAPQLDDVSGGLDALVEKNSTAIETEMASASGAGKRAVTTLWTAIGVGVTLVVLFGLWVASRVRRPVEQVRDALKALAAGDLTHSVAIDTRDEIGDMAHSLNAAQESLREAMSRIASSSTTLAGSAEELSAVSAQVAAAASETSHASGSAASAAEEVSRNVQTVAAATEEMTSSIREISSSSADAVRIAQSAATEAVAANSTVSKLGESSREIGDVVKVITSIAEQTNLLALNATIEAARAGEAGKGFAVVATEVKDLAQETARATEDISRRIEAIQSDTEAAVAAIGRIATIIDEVNTYQTTIASAVEEQTATTSEMARNVSDAASGSGTIATTIEGVATSAQSAASGIGEAQRAASELAQLSGELRELVDRFRI